MIAIETWFAEPEHASPRISPDGQWLSWLAPVDRVLQIHLGRIDVLSEENPQVITAADRSVLHYFWAPDSSAVIYGRDDDGSENWRLVRADLDSGAQHELTPSGAQATIERVDPAHPHHIAISLNLDNPAWPDVFTLDLRTGELVKILDNPGLASFVVGADLRVHGGTIAHDDGSTQIVVHEPDGSWSSVLQVPHEDTLTTEVVGISGDGTHLWVITSVGRATAALAQIDVRTGELQWRHCDDLHDVVGVQLDPHDGTLQASAVLAERLEYTTYDPASSQIFTDLTSHHDGDLVVHGRDDDERRWVAAYIGDTAAPSYHLWDARTRSGRHLFDMYPNLANAALAPMTPFTFTARDGLDLHGYVTLPAAAQVPPPAVLLVHGGPWFRDRWGFHPEAQWLADRGFACVQVNFRGSTGYGKDLINRGDHEWGGAMSDDLVDAVESLAARGMIDPTRVSIMGGSFGGYAALMGAIAHPEVFRAAVAYAPPTDLLTFTDTMPAYWTPLRKQFFARVGDPMNPTERAMLRARSPRWNLDRLRVPVLVAYGLNDPRVSASETAEFVAELRKRELPHTELVFPDEGHTLVKLANRLRYYKAVERFLT